MLTRIQIKVDGDRVRQPGVNFGYGDSDPYLIAREGDLFLVRRPATREWTGIGSAPHSLPAEWWLFRVDKDMRVVEVLEERKSGRKWRVIQEEMLAKMKALAKEMKKGEN